MCSPQGPRVLPDMGANHHAKTSVFVLRERREGQGSRSSGIVFSGTVWTNTSTGSISRGWHASLRSFVIFAVWEAEEPISRSERTGFDTIAWYLPQCLKNVPCISGAKDEATRWSLDSADSTVGTYGHSLFTTDRLGGFLDSRSHSPLCTLANRYSFGSKIFPYQPCRSCSLVGHSAWPNNLEYLVGNIS